MKYYHNYHKGDIIRVRITGINPKYGIFTETKEGIAGLIYKDDFNMSEYDFSNGDDVDVIIKLVKPDGKLDLSYIEKKRIDTLRSQIKEGDIVEAEVLSVDNKNARIEITNANVECELSRKELSPNEVIRASDEVFVGEHIDVVYLGYKDGKMLFSRRPLIKDKYDKKLYDLSLMELLATMGLTTNRFKGKCIEIRNKYFLTDLMSVDVESDDNDGKLLIDPVNGRNLFVIIDNKLRNFFIADNYYEVDIDMAYKEYRLNKGTPYMFYIASNNIKEVPNPYKESVEISFKQHTSPNTNKSIAALLEEVGQNLYSSKKRMFFELLQNADDEASGNGVKVKIQIKGDYFVLTHDGYAFNRHDFESLTSAAQSTKSANRKKTGYKGIGFKSVFTNSDTVLVKSCGFTFKFDKNYPVFNNFEEFYFYVNDIDGNLQGQEAFIRKFKTYKESFNGVKDVPWHLLPIWTDDLQIDEENSIFNEKGNVAIALKMSIDKLEEYNSAIKEVFREPRFMLFLRNTNRIQLIRDNSCLTIQKNISDDGKRISLIKSSEKSNRIEDYSIYTIDDIEVSDPAFSDAGIMIKKEERTNNRGEKENYFIRVDESGNSIGEVTGIPDRITSSTTTAISFAIKLDANNHINTLGDNTLSLYVYLPMNEHRFKFPFFINAEFIPKSDREGVQSDNPWNHFLFYTIGKSIVTMVSDQASLEEPEYLNLLLPEDFQSGSQDTATLTEAFNRGYHSALDNVKFILNDKGEVVGSNDIVYDESGLADAIGASNFYALTGTEKRLPHASINSKILSKKIFHIEKYTTDSVCQSLISHIDELKNWLEATSEGQRNNFYKWIVEKKETTKSLIPQVPAFKFGNEWKSISEISLTNKMLILTKRIIPIKDVLIKLGFAISCQSLENHPLKSYVGRQEEKKIFEKIKDADNACLNFSERLLLFKESANFDGIWKETLCNWNIFKNQNGEYKPLACLFAYKSECPSWLLSYMLSQEEYDKDFDKYLVSADNIFSVIIKPNINDILSKTDITEVYKTFKDSWQAEFTYQLFTNKNISKLSLLSIVEESDNDIKGSYISSVKLLPLYSSSSYDETSYEYRIIRLATLNDRTVSQICSVITIDGKNLSEYTNKDDLTITINNGLPYKFSLSKILNSSSLSSVLGKILEKFSSIPGLEKIFAQKEAKPKDVMDKLHNELSTSTQSITADQFCFFLAYLNTYGIYHFSQYSSHIINENVFLEVLDRVMEMGLENTLKDVILKGRIVFPFDKLISTYYDSDEYTLSSERTPGYINAWADTPEKKRFLIKLGLHDNQNEEIKRRKSFKEKKDETIWNLKDRNIIDNFLNWVLQTFDLPITNENQVKVLSSLLSVFYEKPLYHIDDFSEAREWTNSRYLEWKKQKGIRIYTIEGLLPYRGMYKNTWLYKGFSGEYKYFEDSKTIYISSNKEPERILVDVYSDGNTKCFTKDDWNSIFMVSANMLHEKERVIEEKEKEIEELMRKLEYPENDPEVKEHGKLTERDNLSKEERMELNKEARFAAKEFLDSLDDYDCSDWNPETIGQIIKGKIKYKGKPIVVAVTSSRARKLYLHPGVFAEIMENPDNLLLNYGADQEIHSLSFEDIFTDNPNVNLIFDTDVINAKHIAELANKYRSSPKTCFVIENPHYSQSDAIKSFGLNEKKEGGNVDTEFTDEDIWVW